MYTPPPFKPNRSASFAFAELMDELRPNAFVNEPAEVKP
jgi:hypothetical protein